MIRIGVVGAGRHSRREHLPALRDLVRARAGAVALAAICDLNADAAAAAAREFGVERCVDSLDALIAMRPDAIVAITPVSATAEVSVRIMEAGIPVLIEKPLGRDAGEAGRIADAARGRAAMVSVNRRFDPGIARLAGWLGDRTITHVRATLTRHAREAEGFVEDVGIHAIDTLRFLAGDLESVSDAGIRFASGATGVIELFPAAGHWQETYDVFGPGFHAQACATESCRAWEGGKLAFDFAQDASAAAYVRTGTFAETEAFLDSLSGVRPWNPRPADVVQSVLAAFSLAATRSAVM